LLKNVNKIYLNFCIILPSFGVVVVGTGISCVALIFVLPGRPSNAGSKTKEKIRFDSFCIII
jgi:hypothetical protein